MAIVTMPKNKFVSMTAAGPPGAHKVLIGLPGIGGIRERADGGVLRTKVPELPFLGVGYVKFALVRSALCVSEPHTAERATLFTNSVLNIKVNEILTEMATDEQSYIGALTATSVDTSASSDHRELAFKKLRPSRDYLHAIEQVQSNPASTSRSSWSLRTRPMYCTSWIKRSASWNGTTLTRPCGKFKTMSAVPLLWRQG